MFSNFVIAAAGNLILHTHEDLRVLVERHGGKYSEAVDDETTHLICSAFAYKSRTQKVESAIEIKPIKIVDVYWIEDSVEGGEALPEEKYLILDENHLAAHAPGSEENGDKKRSFDDANSDGEASDEMGPHAKRAREKGAMKSNVIEESTEEVMEGIEKAVKAERIVELDRGWISETSVHVYTDEKETLYEKWLSRIDVTKDTSTEILVLQILETDTEPRKYALCCSDSNGVRKAIYGQSYIGLADGLEDLISVYKSELGKRTLEGYLHIDIDYSLERHAVEAVLSKQTLEARIAFYNLLGHILRPKIARPKKLEARTAEYERLVIKNISKATIKKGEKILGMLKKSIANSPGLSVSSEQAGTEKAAIQNKEDLVKLTSSYYGYIPRLFETDGPIMLLDSLERIQEEHDMLKSLKSIRKSAIMAKEIKLQDNGHEDTLREHFKSLNLKEIDIVDNGSQEFKHIERYFLNTGGWLHSNTLQIFRIERLGDEERWNKAGWNKKTGKHDNRRLLWHGTGVDSIHTILRGGLRDVNALGGVYFSDTAETSISYCESHQSSPPFFLFLCEVQLGYMSRYSHSDGMSTGEFGIQRGIMKYKWSDAGILNKSLQGVRMPDVKTPESLEYEHVEWIASHSPSQIKHRYLVIC